MRICADDAPLHRTRPAIHQPLKADRVAISDDQEGPLRFQLSRRVAKVAEGWRSRPVPPRDVLRPLSAEARRKCRGLQAPGSGRKRLRIDVSDKHPAFLRWAEFLLARLRNGHPLVWVHAMSAIKKARHPAS